MFSAWFDCLGVNALPSIRCGGFLSSCSHMRTKNNTHTHTHKKKKKKNSTSIWGIDRNNNSTGVCSALLQTPLISLSLSCPSLLAVFVVTAVHPLMCGEQTRAACAFLPVSHFFVYALVQMVSWSQTSSSLCMPNLCAANCLRFPHPLDKQGRQRSRRK